MEGLLTLFALAGALVLFLVTWRLYDSLIHPSRCTYGSALARGCATDPADIGLNATETVIRFDDESVTPAWLIDGDRHDPDAPIVVITHGWSNGRYGVLPLAKVFTPYVHRVVVYDVRGQGESTADFTTLGRLERDDLLTVIDHAQDEGGNRPIVLFGSSLGATITLLGAQRLMEQPNDRRQLAGLILEGVYRTDMAPVRRRMNLMNMPAWPFVDLAQGLLKLTCWRGCDAYDARAIISRLRTPILFIHGETDRICPLDEAREVAEPAANGMFVVIPDAGHSRLAEHGPDRYLDAVEMFMQQLREPEKLAPRAAIESS